MAGDPTDSVSVRVPAKINLDLSIGPRASDGFHPLHTVFHAVSLYDDLTIRAVPAADGAQPPGGVSIEVTGLGSDLVPLDETNLAVRAVRLLARRVGREYATACPDLHLTLHKGIPVAGGMAGGSADAAAALVACDALWGSGLPREELIDLAADLGSDVAFALVGGTAVGSGRGERITSALARGQYHWVLVPSADGLSTAAVYAEHDRLTRGRAATSPRVGDAVMQALRGADAPALGRALRNDLQDAACSLRPELADLLDLGIEYGALGGVVSGSGPTVAFLVRDHEQALDLSVALAASGSCPAVLRAHGPVPGARVGDLTRVG
jgi:4-diphosphocytidyl-2-C-methyl-D-erythritol kinase